MQAAAPLPNPSSVLRHGGVNRPYKIDPTTGTNTKTHPIARESDTEPTYTTSQIHHRSLEAIGRDVAGIGYAQILIYHHHEPPTSTVGKTGGTDGQANRRTTHP
ncbi:hypothetical protein A2U01_0038388 [Trifolium medium]|uniref:Uncharacterized protein n=1 Tax=Trifolium medium TaxID=97028 RepID=A0A392PYR2_9FABA|nr:hypothetical protein [Trifolium medium]